MSISVHRVVLRSSLVGLVLAAPLVALAANLSGAIFTTTVDGSVVNENVHYETKPDVYLDGGPGPNAPASAAGLPEGDYYYQVTDPSGQDLLSTDHISCRRVHVNAAGVIDTVYPGTNYAKVKGSYAGSTCLHASGTDVDHTEEGAVTVQLFPFDDTPNLGGVYKVWLTPTSDYTGSTAACPTSGSCNVNGESYTPGNHHGFVSSRSKTDNFKVKYKGRTFTAPLLSVSKFHDANMSGVQDVGEESVSGWAVDVTDTLGVVNTVYTAATVTAYTAGVYTFVEATPAGTAQTVAYRDGVEQSGYPTASPTVSVTVAGTSGETHSVVYGNVGLGSFDACKVFDRNGNGVEDVGEELVAGWQFTLTGTDVLGGTVDSTQYTDETGCTAWDDLLPGSYTVTEGVELSGEWQSTGATSASGDVVSTLSGATMAGTTLAADYTNIRFLFADFGTKGYWSNPNGMAELSQADIDEANALDPYASPSDYASKTDEPFDGYLSDGVTMVCTENAGSSCPSFQDEVSEFLTEDNGGGTHEEQLAQQLLAFLFNTQHRLDGGDGGLLMPDGSIMMASDLIAAAVDTWNFGSDAEVVAMQELLESFNSSDAVQFVPLDPGTPVF